MDSLISLLPTEPGMITLDQIMTRRVVTVAMDDTLHTIHTIFQHTPFHHLLVVERGVLQGIITDRDVLKALSPFVATVAERPQDVETLCKRAHQIMHRHPVTASRQTPILVACQLLLTHNVSCVPVTSTTGAVEGIVTWKDLLRWVVSSCGHS